MKGRDIPKLELIIRSNDINLKLPSALAIEIKFVYVEPGIFEMGSRGNADHEAPMHRVQISRGFYLSETPVTQAQFEVWSGTELPEHKNQFKDNAECPAESMSWFEAKAYCEWLSGACSDQLEYPRGFEADLPSEAQWEYACRGGSGSDTRYRGEYEGKNGGRDGEDALKELGWFENNSNDSTQPVKQKEPNGLGLYDMHGNVDEWCRDVYRKEAYKWREDGVLDPEERLRQGEDAESAFRVVRGGSWVVSARFCRSAFRIGRGPVFRYRGLGFRVGLFPGPSTGK